MKTGVMRSNRMLAGAFGLLLALALVVSLAAPAFAVPLQPHQFYGDVTIDYVQAPEGTTISAQIDGVEYGATTVDAFGRYGHTPNFFVSAEDPDVAGKQGGINGDTVMFYVGGVYAGNVTFAIGGATELDLALGEVVQYTLTVDSTDCGNATGPGEGDFIYNAGTDVPLVAEAWADCCFVNWTGDVATVADVNAASTTITMNGDYSITANFVSKVVLTAASGTGGTVTVPGEGDFPYCPDDVADITAVPDAGYEFASWTGDVGTVADANAASTTITMDADYSVMANFNFVGTNTLTTASTAGGAVTEPGEPGPFTYSTGAVVDLLAVADTGYAFVDWTGDVTTVGDVEDADTTITVDGDYSIQANFEQVQVMYTLTLQVLPIGTGVTTPAIGDHDYAADTVVPISAVAGTNYVFSSWTGDVANPLSQNTSVTMDADKTVTANFSFTGGGGGGYFPPATATPTPTASPTPSPTPVVTPTPTPVVTPPPLPPIPPFDLTDVIDENGVVGEDASYEAPEGQLGISIGAGTTAKTAAGEPVEEIEITEVCVNIPPPPANAYIVGCAYDFGPDGATFDPPITITISYDPGQIPSGVAEGDLVIAYYDVSAGQWVTLATTVDTATHELSAEVDGFTLFAAYGEGEVAPTPPPATPTPPPVTPTPTPAPEEAGTNVGVIIGPIIAVIVIGIVAYWFLRRRGQAEE